MGNNPVLTIAVPIFNMEWCLGKNLATYADPRLGDRIEVLCLNNASEDRSKAIIQEYVGERPETFQLIDRDSRGYGSSINAALAAAAGRYFRIIDADDWVDTDELVKLVDALAACDTDVVLTDYRIADMSTGTEIPVRAGDKGVPYGEILRDFYWPTQTLPSIHNTTYRTAFLRSTGFSMPDMRYFVDEEYVIIPYLHAKTIVYYPYDVYRYQVANPEQSTSPKNRAKYSGHREENLKGTIMEYQLALREDSGNAALSYCRERIIRGIGDHFTTLYMYVSDRKEGRAMATAWKNYVQANAPEFWNPVRRKASLLSFLNRLGVSLPAYLRLKGILLKG